jgi:hypothetical protein
MTYYDWEILSVYATPSDNGLSNVVKRVTWRYQAKEDTFVADVYKDTYFTGTDPNNFVDYANLTEQTVFGWISSQEDIDAIRSELDAKLLEVKSPKIIEKRLPWDKSSNYSGAEVYVIVSDGSVVHGPVAWDSNALNDELNKLGIDDVLPANILAYKQGIVPVYSPLNVTETIQIYQAVDAVQTVPEGQYLDQTTVTWTFNTGIAVCSYAIKDKEPAPVPTLDELKAQKIDGVRSTVSSKESSGTVTVTVLSGAGKFAIDPSSMTYYARKELYMASDATVVFADMDGKDVTLTKDNFLAVIQAGDAFIESAKTWGRQKRDAIKACTTKEELNNLNLEIE